MPAIAGFWCQARPMSLPRVPSPAQSDALNRAIGGSPTRRGSGGMAAGAPRASPSRSVVSFGCRGCPAARSRPAGGTPAGSPGSPSISPIAAGECAPGPIFSLLCEDPCPISPRHCERRGARSPGVVGEQSVRLPLLRFQIGSSILDNFTPRARARVNLRPPS